MSENTITATWQGAMSFEVEVNEHKIVLDAKSDVGGQDRGPRPKPLLLVSLAGCTGMDVAYFLKKMRVEYDSFKVTVSGNMTTEHPKTYDAMHTVYEFTGTDLEAKLDNIKKAISLSQDKYCGVSALFKKAGVNLSSDTIVNGKKI